MQTVSIALTTYNGERFLREQLDSVLAQTIPFTELIVVDDRSTDHTWDILCEYSEKDTRIRLYRNEKNYGYLKNFEKALSLCSGEYIALCDQDDIWLPEHLEVLLTGIRDKCLAAGDAIIVDSVGSSTGRKLSRTLNLDYVPANSLAKAFFIFFYRSPYHGMTMLMKKDFLEKALPIPQELKYHDIWFGSLACFYGGLNYIDTPVTLYRRHSNAVSGGKKHLSRMRTLISHVLLKKELSDRPALTRCIRDRLAGCLNNRQVNFLNQADRYYQRRKSLPGRICNLFFDIKNFKLIYGYK